MTTQLGESQINDPSEWEHPAKENPVASEEIYECPRCGWIDYKSNVKQEKPMKDKVNNCIDNDPSTTKWENKVIFESEEEARVFVKKGIPIKHLKYDGDDTYSDFINDTIVVFRREGYIRKSVVEEAEEMYNKMSNRYLCFAGDLEIAINYVKALKAENERLSDGMKPRSDK